MGEPIGRTVVDLHGDKVQSAMLPGDHFRTKHDKIKRCIAELSTWVGVPITVEVWGLLAPSIPQAGLNRIEGFRQRQSIVPDFRLQLKGQDGVSRFHLAELKTLNGCSETRYKSTHRERAVDKRANELTSLYRYKARSTDQTYCGIARGEVGPVESRLLHYGEVIGFVAGAFGEVSGDIHKYIQYLSEARLAKVGLKRGQQGGADEMGLIVGQVRRKVSTAVARAQVDSLIARLHMAGERGVTATKRRAVTEREEVEMDRERRAVFLAHVRGYGPTQHGRIHV